MPLYRRLDQARNAREDLAEGDIRPLIEAIEPNKQRKYSKVIKYIVKTVSQQETKIFASLHTLYQAQPVAEKLSKSQQRFTIPLVAGDAGHGLCFQMAVLWLAEQFRNPLFGTKFPRLAAGNVVGSKQALALTQESLTLRAAGSYDEQARRAGLALNREHFDTSFASFAGMYGRQTGIRAFLATFWQGQHAVAMFRENDRHCLFYNANAGSYRVPVGKFDRVSEEIQRSLSTAEMGYVRGSHSHPLLELVFGYQTVTGARRSVLMPAMTRQRCEPCTIHSAL